MKNPAQQPTKHLLDDAMSTTSLDDFYNNVEQQLVARMESAAPMPPVNGSHKKWLGLGGSAAVLVLVGAAVVYFTSDTPSPTVVVDRVQQQEQPAAVTTTTRPTEHVTALSTSPRPASQQQNIGTTSVARVTAQAQPTRTLSAQTQRDIDSLRTALNSASTPSDAARIGYQLGLRYRIAGDHATALDLLITSSATAQTVGAHTLAAKGRQQAAKAALQLGDKAQATSLYEQALRILPASEVDLRDRWRSELDSLQR